MRSREQRNQSNRNEDPIGLHRHGVARQRVVVTGEDKDDESSPAPLFQGGLGAIELAVATKSLAFESASNEGPDFTIRARTTSCPTR